MSASDDTQEPRYTWPNPLDLHTLATQEPGQPGFVLNDWMPEDYATLLAGHGGAGKSGIALHLACCIALERQFCGIATKRKRVLYMSCEDRWPVLHWRLSHLARHLSIELNELCDKLFLHDLVGQDTILWERDPRTGFTLTAGFAHLQDRMTTTGAEVLIVDGISDTFAGNENARGDVKRFVNSLLALIPPDGALLLVGHVDKESARNPTTSQGFSGSTAWHNSVRARWYLYPERSESDESSARPTGDLVLELQKTNHGPTTGAIRFAWDDRAHMFVGRTDDAVGGMVESIRDQAERDAILRAIVASTDDNLPVPAAMQGPRTAYAVLTHRPEFPESLKGDKSAKKRRFARHLEGLRQIRHIVEGSIRRNNRHSTATIDPTTEGRAACVK